MEKNDVKSVLEFLSNEEKVESMLHKVNEEAVTIYEDFGATPLDIYSFLTDEYKDKMAEVIANELKTT